MPAAVSGGGGDWAYRPGLRQRNCCETDIDATARYRGELLAAAVAEFESPSGGGIATDPDFFDAPIEDVASVDVSDVTPENYLAIDANNVITNRGGFTIEIGTNTHQAIKVPIDGNYTIAAVTSIDDNFLQAFQETAHAFSLSLFVLV